MHFIWQPNSLRFGEGQTAAPWFVDFARAQKSKPRRFWNRHFILTSFRETSCVGNTRKAVFYVYSAGTNRTRLKAEKEGVGIYPVPKQIFFLLVLKTSKLHLSILLSLLWPVSLCSSETWIALWRLSFFRLILGVFTLMLQPLALSPWLLAPKHLFIQVLILEWVAWKEENQGDEGNSVQINSFQKDCF